MDDWNYNSCRLTLLAVWDLKNFKHLIFIAQSVHYTISEKETICTIFNPPYSITL